MSNERVIIDLRDVDLSKPVFVRQELRDINPYTVTTLDFWFKSLVKRLDGADFPRDARFFLVTEDQKKELGVHRYGVPFVTDLGRS